jgi:hypothetical protein
VRSATDSTQSTSVASPTDSASSPMQPSQ